MPNNKLTLAVAGSRKTQGIVEACKTELEDTRILILTYTTANQVELKSRLRSAIGDRPTVEVSGWFSFLIRDIIKPYLPFKFPKMRVQGFDFESGPRQGTTVDAYNRYFNPNSSVLKAHLPQLAFKVEEASGNQGMERISKLYDKIYIDEVQDLCGYDLEILDMLMKLDVELIMVGDVRQAVLATNERERKNKQYMYMEIWKWFKQKERTGQLTITQSNKTWRCRSEIALLADSLFGSEWDFDTTESLNTSTTPHDGIYFVKNTDIQSYLDKFSPLFLRYSRASGRNLPYDFMNYRMSKGLSRQRVLILPTNPIRAFLTSSTALNTSQASQLYVAVTRAEQSVAFVMENAGSSEIPFWSPTLK